MPVSSISLCWTLATRNWGWMRRVQSEFTYILYLILCPSYPISAFKHFILTPLQMTPLWTSLKTPCWSWCGKTMSVWKSMSWWAPRNWSMKRTQALWVRQPEQDTSPWSSASTSLQGQRCWHQRRHGNDILNVIYTSSVKMSPFIIMQCVAKTRKFRALSFIKCWKYWLLLDCPLTKHKNSSIYEAYGPCLCSVF